MRRRGPRPLAGALHAVTTQARPQTVLARVQAAWDEVVGETVAAEARPRAEAGGTVVLECSSGVWAQELELLSPDLLERLNGALGGGRGTPVRAFRFTVRGRA